MIIKLAIALVVVLIIAAFATWAFLPARHLPGNRARHLRIRLHLRLHPGKGFAHLFTLHLRWSRFAALRRSSRIRPALPMRYRILDQIGAATHPIRRDDHLHVRDIGHGVQRRLRHRPDAPHCENKGAGEHQEPIRRTPIDNACNHLLLRVGPHPHALAVASAPDLFTNASR